MRGLILATVLTIVSTTLAVPKCGPNDDILLPNPTDCTTYYRCLHGVVFLMPCPPGLHWSKESSRCDYPEVAQCTETETKPPTEATSKKPSTPRPDHCPEKDGPEDVLLPNPADCGSFYKCLNGIPHLIPCPSGQKWSVELNRCDLPEVAKCVETETSSVATATPSRPSTARPDHCPEVDGPVDVLLPNPKDCGSFFKCLKGEPHLIRCPSGQEWSIEHNRCDYPEIAKCKVTAIKHFQFEKEANSTEITTSSEEESECPLHNEGFDILLPNPEDCATYYQCSNGVKILKKCPEGTLWHAPMTRCDHAAIAECA